MPPTPADQIRLIAFDLDGTLIDETIYVWQTLHQHFSTDSQRRQQARADYRAGRITYAQWFDTDLELLTARGATRARIRACFAGLRPASGARQTLAALKSRGYRLGLISGSLDILLDQFFPTHPFDWVHINRLHFAPDGSIAGGRPTPYDMAGKADGLAAMAEESGLPLAQCAFIGDNVNDLDVMRAAGLSIAVHVKHPDVARTADLVIESTDLRALLPLFPGPKGGGTSA